MSNCWKCRKDIEQTDNFCRHCGMGQGGKMPFYYHHWGVWLLFLLIGPFNLWFLFRSPLISQKWKIIDTIIILLVTAVFCWSFYRAVSNIFGMYSSLMYASY